MECKVVLQIVFENLFAVLMEPKWNVKAGKRHKNNSRLAVLMEPKWNVKESCLVHFPVCRKY